MRKKTLALLSTFLLFVILARTETADAQTMALAVDSKTVDISVTQLFTVSINITNAPTMTQYIMTSITWDPAVLELETGTDADVVKGDFLAGDVFIATIGSMSGNIEEVTEGKLSGTKSGSGNLFKIKFRAKTEGTSLVGIGFCILLNDLTPVGDTTGLYGYIAVTNGTIDVVPEFPIAMLLPCFLIVTTIAIIAATVWSRKRQIPIKIP
jgi:hypothetical protein